MKGLDYLVKEGFRNVWSNRMMSISSIGVLISCLVLTGTAILICGSVQKEVKVIGDSNIINVYLSDAVAGDDVYAVGADIENISNVENCEFYSKDEAIASYQEMLGDVFDEMQGEQNPLPDTYHVTLKDLSQYDETIQKLESINGVDSVSNRKALADKLTSLNNLVATMGFWIVLILGIISLFIISNTIKMSMYSRRYEISIMKSVGATDGFVRIPFVVEGMLIGFASGVVSTFLLGFLYNGIISAAQQIVHFTAIEYWHLAFPIGALFVLAGMFVGAMGGVISISKYLKKEGNEILGW
ncbi:MAG TPA: ABC transporter permease [Clostridiales bacterium]|nr:ABC transporter permease [Clostridiales bacterium]